MVEHHLGASRMYFSVYSKIYTSTSTNSLKSSPLKTLRQSLLQPLQQRNPGNKQTRTISLLRPFRSDQIHEATRCSFDHHRAMDSVSKSEKFHHTCKHRRRRPQPDRGSFSAERPSRPSYSAESSNICAGTNRLP